MKKRMKFFLYILIIIIFFSIFLVIYIDQKLSPIIMEYSVAQAKKIVSIIVNRSINSDLFLKSDVDHLYTIIHSENGDILSLNSVI